MNPRTLHQEAMNYSFQAKEALARGDDSEAFELYARAAEIETDVAKFYYDKPDLEPTRGTIIRSAAFLNLKAGKVVEAQQIIFWGLLNLTNEVVKEQLNDALSLTVMLKNVPTGQAGAVSDYFARLRQRSIFYTLESKTNTFSTAVTLDMMSDFLDEMKKSVRAYAIAQFERFVSTLKKVPANIDTARRQFENLSAPLLTGVSLGSFRFSLANDFLQREAEQPEVSRLKADTLIKYHDEIFTRTLDDEHIALLKQEYTPDELDKIFRPIANIQDEKTPYTIGYYDRESYQKLYVPKITAIQRKKLLTKDGPETKNVGVLESSVVYVRELSKGRKEQRTIFKEQLNAYSLTKSIEQIDPGDKRPLPLRKKLSVDIQFNKATGFRFYSADFDVEHTDTDPQKGEETFQSLLYDRIIAIVNGDLEQKESKNWRMLVDTLLTNPDSLKTK
jgi:hypothetical protein